MLNPATIAAYDASRQMGAQPFRAACYSPFASLYFHTTGQVLACCMNKSYVMGHISRQSLDEIWNGPATQVIRQAMLDYEFVPGCDHCVWQIHDGTFSEPDPYHQRVHAMKYDEYRVGDGAALWPVNMEFNLSNVCNLECVMCYGELSSAIRAHRDKLPPMAKPYGEQFFTDLRKYLPHLKSAQFLGGEPFLIQENYRVWEMLVEESVSLRNFVTTNGTQYNARIERVLEQLPTSITISMDSARPQTLESIRVNLKFDEFMRNFERFHGYCRRQGTVFGLNFTLMRQNCREFREFLEFAENWDCPVSVPTCTSPADYSVYSLDRSEFQALVDEMRRQEAASSVVLRRNRSVWNATMAMLENRLKNFGDASLDFMVKSPKLTAPFLNRWNPQIIADESVQAAQAQQTLGEWSPLAVVETLECDLDDQVTAVHRAERGWLARVGIDPVGHSDQELFGRMRSVFGEKVHAVQESVTMESTDRVIRFTAAGGANTEVRVITVPRYNAAGDLSGSRIFVAMAATEAPVAGPA